MKRFITRRMKKIGAARGAPQPPTPVNQRPAPVAAPDVPEGVSATLTPWFDLVQHPSASVHDRTRSPAPPVILAGRYLLLASPGSAQRTLIDLACGREVVVWRGRSRGPLLITDRGHILDAQQSPLAKYPDEPFSCYDITTRVVYPLGVADAIAGPIAGLLRPCLPRVGQRVPVVLEHRAGAISTPYCLGVDVIRARVAWRVDRLAPLAFPFDATGARLFGIRGKPGDPDAALVLLDVRSGELAWTHELSPDDPWPERVIWCDQGIVAIAASGFVTFIEHDLGVLLETVPGYVLPAIGGGSSAVPVGATQPTPVRYGFAVFNHPEIGSETATYRVVKAESEGALRQQSSGRLPSVLTEPPAPYAQIPAPSSETSAARSTRRAPRIEVSAAEPKQRAPRLPEEETAAAPATPKLGPVGVTPPGGLPAGITPPGGLPVGVTPPGGLPVGVTPPGGLPAGVTPPGGLPVGVTPPGGVPQAAVSEPAEGELVGDEAVHVPVLVLMRWAIDRAKGLLGAPARLPLPITVRPFLSPPTHATVHGPWTVVANLGERPWVLGYFVGEICFQVIGDAPRLIAWRSATEGTFLARRSLYRFSPKGCERVQRFGRPASLPGADGSGQDVTAVAFADTLLAAYGTQALVRLAQPPATLLPIAPVFPAGL